MIWTLRDKDKSKPSALTDEALPQVGRVRRKIDLTKSQPVQIFQT